MFSILSTLTKQELEKIYELTYKYGWITSEERSEGYLEDNAYMEKAKIEGELEPLIDEKLKFLYEDFNAYVSLGSVTVIYEIIDKVNVSTFLDFVAGHVFTMSNYYDFFSTFICEKYPVRGLRKFYEHHRLDIVKDNAEDFILYLLANSTEKEQENIYEELESLSNIPSYKGVEEETYVLLYENAFIEWLIANGPTFKDLTDTYGMSNELMELIATENFTKEEWKDFMTTVLDAILMKDKGFQWELTLERNFETIKEAMETGTLSDKIIAFQVGITTAHSGGPMLTHLIDDIGERGAKRLLNQLSSDKYVAQWNKELQQATGIRVGASIHLRSALVLLERYSLLC